MNDSGSRPASGTRGGRLFSKRRLAAILWPRGPLALILFLAGVLNILDGLRLSLPIMHRLRALNGLVESISAVGGTTQSILGLMLAVAGIGLLRRLSFAWTLSVLLLAISTFVNILRQRWGGHLVTDVVLLAILMMVKGQFTRRTALGSTLLSISSILAILAYGIFGSYLLGAGFHPAIQDLSTACYFTIVSLSTVGYGDIVPTSPETRWFVVSLLVLGLGVFASAIASALGPKISGELNRLFNPKEKFMDLKEHVILVGEGAIARNTAKELERRGVPFVQIVSAKQAAEAADTHRILEGDATSDAVLREAGIQKARMVIAAREDDGENAFIALGSKDLNPNVRVLAVASSSLSIRRLKLARADLVFSPSAVGSRLLADLVQGRPILPEFQDLLEGLPKQDKP